MTAQFPPDSPDLPELSAETEADYTPPTDLDTEPTTETGEAPEAADSAPLVSVRRRRAAINWRVLGAIIALLLLTAFLYGGSQNALPVEILTWWPAAILVISIVWLFSALARARAPGAIGAAGLTGIGLSLLLATAFQVALGSSLVGITFIALGMGVILRGLLIRPTPIH
jgi:hypothetical protein